MSINLTDEIDVKTKKGKLGAAKQIFLEGDTQTVENEIQDINYRHNTLNTKYESLSKTVQGIATTGGASTATNVTYNNDSSELNAENAQDAIDEVSSIGHFAKRGGIVNISTNYNSTNTVEVLTLEQAITRVPSKDRVLGFQCKFLSENGWESYIFKGESITDWSNKSKWNKYYTKEEIDDLQAKQDNKLAELSSKVISSYQEKYSGSYVDGKYINENGDESEFTSDNLSCSDYIDIEGESVIGIYIGPWKYGIKGCFYDKNKTFIAKIQHEQGDVGGDENIGSIINESVPTNAKYIRFNTYTKNKDLVLISRLNDTIKNTLTTISALKNSIDINSKQSSIGYETYEGTYTDGYYTEEGNLSAFSGVSCSDYLEVDSWNEITIFVYDYPYASIVDFYDLNKNYVSNIESGNYNKSYYNFIVPENIKYIRFNIKTENKYKIKISKKITGYTKYEPFNFVSEMILVEGSENKFISNNNEIKDLNGLGGFYDYYRVNPSTNYKIYNPTNYIDLLCFYDKNKSFISGFQQSKAEPSYSDVITPSNCYYIRLNRFLSTNPPKMFYSNDYYEGKYYFDWMPYFSNYKLKDIPSDIEPSDLIDFDTYRLDTFVGSYNYVIKKVLERKPRARFVIVTHYTDDGGGKNSLLYLTKAQRAIAQYWGIKLIDLARCLNWVNRNGINVISSLIPDSLHPAGDYDNNTRRSKNVDTIAAVLANQLRDIFDNWTDKKIAWFGTSIPDGTPHVNIDNAQYPIVAVNQILGAICYNYSRSAAIMSKYKFGTTEHPDGNNGNIRHEFSNDDEDYNSVNTGVFETDYNSGHITYKTYILDKIGTEEEADLYVLDFGYNDTLFGQGLNVMNYNSL